MPRTNSYTDVNPTIKYKSKKLDKNLSDLSIQELPNISIPICAKRGIVGCDGTDYELELGNYYGNIIIKWWEDAPEQWKPVNDITKKLMSEFDSILNNVEYADTLNISGKLWLEPMSNIKISKDLFTFLKQFTGFITFLNKLEEKSIYYRLNKIRDESIMVEIAVPGQRWEVEFIDDGSIEIEKFISDKGYYYDEKELDVLFNEFSD